MPGRLRASGDEIAAMDDEADLLARMELNLAEHASHLHRKLVGATVVDGGAL